MPHKIVNGQQVELTAEEIALLARNQILVEAATAMVAQANLIPEQVLRLLPSS